MNATEAALLTTRWAQIKAFHDEHGWSRHLAPHRDLFERLYVEGAKAEAKKRLGPDEIGLLDQALGCSYSEVWADATADLLQTWQPFAQQEIAAWAVRALAHPKAEMRWHLVQISNAFTSEDLRDIILRTGLHDRSGRVREFAADRIVFRMQKHLLPELRAAMSRTKRSEERERLERDCELLEKGFLIVPRPELDQIEIQVQIPGAFIMSSFDRSVVERQGEATLVKKMIKDHQRVHGM
ncbi:MAG: hypothetical protein JNL43_12700 [Flavobacteriales bacterium]|nr:hypothetical protein [Flavobacteriales bacterium]